MGGWGSSWLLEVGDEALLAPAASGWCWGIAFSVREDASWYCWLRYGKLIRGHFQVALQADWWALVFHRADTSARGF